MIRIYIATAILFTAAISCNQTVQPGLLVDENASEATVVLYRNMQQLQGKALMFGHQATLEYGYRWTLVD